MKGKIWTTLLLAVVLAGLFLLAVSFFLDLGRNEVYFKERTGAAVPTCGEDVDAPKIIGWAGPTSTGHFITDIVEYEVAVFFCAEFKVDEKRLEKAVNLSPFEMVGKPKISNATFRNGTRKLLTFTYRIQALHVLPGKEYAFPRIPVEYSLGGKEDVYWIQDVRPIYIAWIISPDSVAKSLEENGGVEFRPLKPELASRSTLFSKSWLEIGGSVLLLFGLAGVLSLITPRLRAKTSEPQGDYQTEVLGILEGIESRVATNVRSSMHSLYNLSLELQRSPDFKDARESLEAIGMAAQDLAYVRDAPPDAEARAHAAVRSIRDIVSKL